MKDKKQEIPNVRKESKIKPIAKIMKIHSENLWFGN